MVNSPTTPTDNEQKTSVTKNPDENQNSSQLWDQIGFHKPMAGFWYNITYTIIAILLSSVLMGYLMNFFYPFPESFGYKDVAFSLFSFMFFLFDIGTGSVMGRYVPEANIKEPEKMLHYIQYFIWYQMCTGLIQTTAISIYALAIVTQDNLAYVVWIMLIASTTQYPGFLSVFSNVLDALQQYHKAQTARFLAGTVVSRIIELAFVYYGKIYGMAHPEVGMILGIAFGSAIGGYVSQFTAMIVSAYFFSTVMKSYGVRPRECFRVQFTWIEVKPVIIYALKTSLPGILGGLLGLLNLWMWISYVPQYTTVLILASIGGSIADIMDWFGSPSITSLVSESYMNNKKELTKYYVGQLFRFNVLLQGFFIPLIIMLSLVMPAAWVALGMTNYLLGTIFIVPRMIKISINRYLGIPGQILYGGNRPNYGMIMGMIQSCLNTGLLYCFLFVWKLPIKYGLLGTAIVMELGLLPLDITFAIIAYIYVHKTMLKIKIPIAQIVIGFVLPAVITFGLMMFIKSMMFDPLFDRYGFFVAVFPSVLLIAIVLFFVYFPLTALMGGWDNTNLEEFRKVAYMSGPSKFLVVPIYKIVNRLCKLSPLHGKFEMPVEGVLREAQELLEIKHTNLDHMKINLGKKV